MNKLPKKLLIVVFGFLILFLSSTNTVSAQTPTSTPAPTVSPGVQAGTVTDPKDLPRDWFIDSEVTAIGKNASRSGLLLDWALQNYDWSYVNPGSTNPLVPFWASLRNVSYAMLFIAIMAGVIIMIVTRGRSVTVRRFIPRFLLVVILVTFSFSLVQFFFQIVDVFQGFFIRPNGVQISQKDLLYIGWNYQPFVGLRALGSENYESAFISLVLVKLTAFTYYVMVGILLVRKIILWFFIIVSPFFALLLFFYPLRNTAKIWLGEFFRWLLYAPLFAVFLAGLVALWKTGIPLLFRFGNVGDVIFPTAVSILLGGPGQLIGVGNSVNLADTFGLYIVALIMLWMVIIFPFVLLQIFLDYINNVNLGNTAIAKQLVNFRNKYPIAPINPSTPPAPVAGIGRNLPFLKDFAIPKSNDIQSIQKETSTTVPASVGSTFTARYIDKSEKERIEQKLAMSIPTMRDIAVYEKSSTLTDTEKQKEVERIKESLRNMANPASILTSIEKDRYTKLREEFSKESQSGNMLAASVLSAAGSTSLEQANISNRNNISNVINNLAGVNTISSQVEKEKIDKLRELIVEKNREGNPIAGLLTQIVKQSSGESSESKVYNLLRSLTSLSQNKIESKDTQLANLKNTLESESSSNEVAKITKQIIEKLTIQNNLVTKLNSILSPGNITDTQTKNQYVQINQTISNYKKEGNNFADFITTNISKLANATSLEGQNKILFELKQELSNQVNNKNPLAVYITNNIPELSKFEPADITNYVSVLEKEKGANTLASQILSISSSQSNKNREKKLDNLQKIIQKGALEKDPLAQSIAGISGLNKPILTQDAKLPDQNRIQQVSLDDYEAVKKMWMESYRELETSENIDSVLTQKDTINEEINQIAQTIDLLSSNDSAKIEQGMQEVSNILPFLLMGGFSQSEIVSYLKAKQEAGKAVIEEIDKKISEDDSVLYIQSRKTRSSLPTNLSQAEHVVSTVGDFSENDNFSEQINSSTLSQGSSNLESVNLLRLANLNIPKIDSIASFDAQYRSNKAGENNQIQKVSNTLKLIKNPNLAQTDTEKKYYEDVREKLLEELGKGNNVAQNVISASNVNNKLNEEELFRGSVKLQDVLNNLANATSIVDENKKSVYEILLKNIKNQKENGNGLADEILSTFASKPIKYSDSYSLFNKITSDQQARSNGLYQPIMDVINANQDSENLEKTEKLKKLNGLFNFIKSSESLSPEEIEIKSQLLKNLDDNLENSRFAKEFKLMLGSVEKGKSTTQTLLAYDMLDEYKSKNDEFARKFDSYIDRAPKRFMSLNFSSTGNSLNSFLSKLILPKWNKSAKEDQGIDEIIKSVKDVSSKDQKLSENIISEINNGTEIFVKSIIDTLTGITEEKSSDEGIKILKDKLSDGSSMDREFISQLNSICQALKNKKITKSNRLFLALMVFEKIKNEADNGNKVADSIRDLISKSSQDYKNWESFKIVIEKLRSPEGLSQEEKETYLNLRDVIVKSEPTSPLAKSINELINQKSSDIKIFKALHLELLRMKQDGQELAVRLLDLIQKEQESDELFGSLNFLKKINNRSLCTSDAELELFSILYEKLTKASSEDDMLAISILSASQAIEGQGTELAETKKVVTNLKHSNSDLSSEVKKLIQEEIKNRQYVQIFKSLIEDLDDKNNHNALREIIESNSKSNFVIQLQTLNRKFKSENPNEKTKFDESEKILNNIRKSKEDNFAQLVLSALDNKYVVYQAQILIDVFKKLINPGVDKEYVEINKMLVSQVDSNYFAKEVVEIAKILSSQENDLSQNDLNKIAGILYTKLDSLKNNDLAQAIVSYINKSALSKTDFSLLEKHLDELKKTNDPIVKNILNLTKSQADLGSDSVYLPSVNSIQAINLDDYETVRHIWEDNYKNMDVPQPVDQEIGRNEYIKRDLERINNTINLLSSNSNEDVSNGLEEVSNILPFLLLGGFSLTEIISYLKAKVQAGQTVLNNLDNKEEISLDRKPQGNMPADQQAKREIDN